MHGKTILSSAMAAAIGLFSGSCVALAGPGVSAGGTFKPITALNQAGG